jgi:hypothetical protein
MSASGKLRWRPAARHYTTLWRIAVPAGALAAAAELSAVSLRAAGAALLLLAFWAGHAAGWLHVRHMRACAAREAGADAGHAEEVELPLAGRALPGTAVAAVAAVAFAVAERGTSRALAAAALLLLAGGYGVAAARAVAAWERRDGIRLYRTAGLPGALALRLAAVAAPPPPPEPAALRRLFRIAPLPSALAAVLLPFVPPAPLSGEGPLPAITGFTHVSRIEPTFGRAASALAGHRVTVRCWSPADWTSLSADSSFPLWGYARVRDETVNLAPWVCDGLARIAYTDAHRPAFPTADDVFAPAVLAHEVAHLDGAGHDERRAECDAVQTMARAARLLGASPGYAEGIARVYWLRDYPHRSPRYLSPECRPGGAFDLHLPGGWP